MISRNQILGLVLGLVVVAGTSGCAFRRTVSNTYHRDLDTSNIIIGQSTWRDVLAELGPPGAGTTESMTAELPTLQYFKYTSRDIKDTRFLLAYVLFLPWQWTDEQADSELMVTFDDDGVVSHIFQSKEDTIWRPLQGEGSREPQVVTSTGGSS